MKILTCGLLLACGALAIGFGARAQAQGSDTTAQDKMFLMQASEGGMAEIAQSQIALRKTKNPEIRTYAQKMIDDHNMLSMNMKPVMDALGVTPPMKLNEAHRIEEKRLNAMSGKDFDAEYVKAMTADHVKTLAMFKNEEATTGNQQLKDTVSQGKPVIQMHTDMIEAMAQKMNLTVPPAGM